MIVSNHLRKLTRVLNASVNDNVFFGHKVLFTEQDYNECKPYCFKLN